jgi:hypothetical protein
MTIVPPSVGLTGRLAKKDLSMAAGTLQVLGTLGSILGESSRVLSWTWHGNACTRLHTAHNQADSCDPSPVWAPNPWRWEINMTQGTFHLIILFCTSQTSGVLREFQFPEGSGLEAVTGRLPVALACQPERGWTPGQPPKLLSPLSCCVPKTSGWQRAANWGTPAQTSPMM